MDINIDIIPSKWTETTYADFRKALCGLSEPEYKKFNSRIIPDTPLCYGIRIPVLRKVAAQILKGDYMSYLSIKKPPYHEEIIIEGLVSAGIDCPYNEMLEYMKVFAGKIYNWAINDTVVFKGIKVHKDRYINDVDCFIRSENPWEQRFGFLHLMNFFLDNEYIDEVLEKVDSVNSDFYYVQMMQAWLLATAAAKQRDKTLAYLQDNNLNSVTMKMTVRKIRESFRISESDKRIISQFGLRTAEAQMPV